MDLMKAYPKWGLIIILVLVHKANLIQGNSEPEHQENGFKCKKSTLSCVGRCQTDEHMDYGQKNFSRSCHCDPSCSKYKDCCRDISTACPNRTAPPPNDVKFKCRKMNEKEPGNWIVEECPSNLIDQEIRKKCHSTDALQVDTFLDQIPVMDGLSGINYKNKWCASCHKVMLPLMFYYQLLVKCNVNPPTLLNYTQTLDYIFKHCNRVHFVLDPERKRRFCYYKNPTIDSCPTNASIEKKKACLQSPTRVVYDRSTLKNYRSIECMACHATTDQLRRAECGPRVDAGNVFTPSSFEIVMNFENRGNAVEVKKEFTRVKCKEDNFVYDGKLEICRKMLTRPTKGIIDKFRIKMWLNPLDQKNPENFTHEEFIKELTNRFVALEPEQVHVLTLMVEDRSTTVMFDLHAKYHNASRKVNKTKDSLDLDMLFSFNQSFEMKFVNRPWLVFKATARRLSCTHKEEYPPSQWYLPYPDHDIALVNISGKVEHIPKNQFYLVREDEVTHFQNSILVVCRSFFGVLCSHSMLGLVDKEFTIFENKSLLFKPTGQWYKEGEYDMRGKTPWICTNYTFSKNKDSVIERIQHKPDIHFEIRRYMTIVGFSISVICLFLVLLTHGILRDLRTPLPGKNLISLSLSLFLAHFWFLLGSGDTDKPVFCRFSAYILHYFFLVSFGCTFIVAYDTRRTFSAKTTKAHAVGTFQHKRLAAYLLISWGIPCVLVMTCAVLDGLDVVHIGYGKGLACWIGNPTALLIVFATPVGLVLVYNVVAFSQTVYAINSARKLGKRIKSNHYTRTITVKIYMRLISLMGFSWFFAISAPLIHHGLMYPFVLFTTLQGLYIFLAFVFKTKVMRMLKAKLPLPQSRRPRPGESGIGIGTISTLADSTPYNKYTQSSKDDTQI